MNYNKLMEKIAAHELQRKAKKNIGEQPAERLHLVEETPHEIQIEEEKKEEVVEEQEQEKITEHEEAVEQPKTKKNTGRKPANRAYMVVEDVEEQNKEDIQE